MKVAATILVLALSTLNQYAYAGSAYEKLRNGPGCPGTQRVKDPNECSQAAASLGFSSKVQTGSWPWAPLGCHVGHPTDGWKHTYFNSKNGQTGHSHYYSICKKVLPACGTGVATENCQCGVVACPPGLICQNGGCTAPAPAPAPAPDCGCGTVTSAQDGCQCGNARCKTGQRCVQGQCKTITSCQRLRIPMARGEFARCKNECRKTYCSGGCQSYNLQYGYSDENKNGCILSSCPYKG